MPRKHPNDSFVETAVINPLAGVDKKNGKATVAQLKRVQDVVYGCFTDDRAQRVTNLCIAQCMGCDFDYETGEPIVDTPREWKSYEITSARTMLGKLWPISPQEIAFASNPELSAKKAEEAFNRVDRMTARALERTAKLKATIADYDRNQERMRRLGFDAEIEIEIETDDEEA